jgi:type VI secretion system protein ImpC
VAADIDKLIAKIVGPHIVPAPDPQQGQLISSVDDAIGSLMRSILHNADFQELEAAWRGVHFLVSGVETDETLKLFVLDVSKEELAADLSAGAVNQSALWKQLVDMTVGSPGGKLWSFFAGLYTFGHGEADVVLLGRLGQVASAAGAPFVAAAAPQTVGAESFIDRPTTDTWAPSPESEAQKRWNGLRNSAVAPWIGLIAPRFMLRLPYGDKGEPVSAFDFEEQTGGATSGGGDHDCYLWASGSIAAALLLAASFTHNRWEMQPGDALQIDDLPVHYWKDRDGESQMKPCAECFMSERVATAFLDHGVMPLASFQNQGSVRLVRFQSMAGKPTALAGRWG